MQEIVSINIVPGRLTIAEKIFILMRDFPELRDSYDMLVEKYHAVYNDSPSRKTIERSARIIQCDLKIYPPSKRIRRMRDEAKQRIIEESKSKGFLGFIRKFFNVGKK